MKENKWIWLYAFGISAWIRARTHARTHVCVCVCVCVCVFVWGCPHFTCFFVFIKMLRLYLLRFWFQEMFKYYRTYSLGAMNKTFETPVLPILRLIIRNILQWGIFWENILNFRKKEKKKVSNVNSFSPCISDKNDTGCVCLESWVKPRINKRLFKR